MNYLIKFGLQCILIILLSCENLDQGKKIYKERCEMARQEFLLGLQGKDNKSLDQKTQGIFEGMFYGSLAQLVECSKPRKRYYSIGGVQFGPKDY